MTETKKRNKFIPEVHKEGNKTTIKQFLCTILHISPGCKESQFYS